MKAKRMITLIALILCISLLAGCASQKALHDVEWGMTAAEVKETVGADKLQENSENAILNQMLTKDYTDLYGDRTVSIAFVFNSEDSLSSITVQLFANSDETLDTAMKNVRTEMEKAYGAAEGEDTAAHWHTDISSISLQKVEGATSFFVALYQPITAHSH